MAVTPELTQRRTSDVAFEVERVRWPSPDRVEIVGRWFGVRGRRFIRPTLHVEVGPERRRLLAVLDHKPWAVEDGQDWVAAFKWHGEPVDLTGSELTVGPDVAVELAPPGEKRAPARRFARRPRTDVLESELERVRQEARRLARELHEARADHAAEINRRTADHEAELENARSIGRAAEQDGERSATALRNEVETERRKAAQLEGALRKAREELAVARSDLASQREALERDRGTLAAAASQAAAGEVEALRQERDAARRESANARAERDAARRESANARAERDAAFRERDSARQERNAFLSRARSEGIKRVPAEPSAPAPPSAAQTPPTGAPVPKPASPTRRTVVRIPAEPSDHVEPPTAVSPELNWQPAEPRADLTIRSAAIGALALGVVVLLLLVGLL